MKGGGEEGREKEGDILTATGVRGRRKEGGRLRRKEPPERAVRHEPEFKLELEMQLGYLGNLWRDVPRCLNSH